MASRAAKIIVNLNASPFHDDIRKVRLRILKRKATRLGVAVFYVNLVGGQDELVFDGQSLAVDRKGRIIGIGKQFEEDLVIVDVDTNGTGLKEVVEPLYNREAEMFNAIVLGVRDYFRKTGFNRSVHRVERRHRLVARGSYRRYSTRQGERDRCLDAVTILK